MKVQFTPQNADVTKYQELTSGNIYQVIGIEADDFRIINDDGLPYLYPGNLFLIVDDREPEEWLTEYGDDGERYAYPAELNRVGFFEDYFDNDQQTIIAFHQYLTKRRIRRNNLFKAA